MKLTKIASTLVAGVALMSGSVHAAPVSVPGGTVHFTGQLVNAACAVSTQSDNQTVHLGQYRTAAFTAVGDTAAQIPFSIVLTNCDNTVAATAAVAFAGQTDAGDPTLLAVNSGGNGITAKGVGIEILDVTSKPLTPNGAMFSTPQSLINGENTLRFSARYKATAATTTAGLANADATFVMKYE